MNPIAALIDLGTRLNTADPVNFIKDEIATYKLRVRRMNIPRWNNREDSLFTQTNDTFGGPGTDYYGPEITISVGDACPSYYFFNSTFSIITFNNADAIAAAGASGIVRPQTITVRPGQFISASGEFNRATYQEFKIVSIRSIPVTDYTL